MFWPEIDSAIWDGGRNKSFRRKQEHIKLHSGFKPRIFLLWCINANHQATMLLQWQSSGLFKRFSLIFFQAIQCSGLVPLSGHFWPHGHIFNTPVSLELELVKRQLSSFGHLTKIPPGCFLDQVFWVYSTRRRPQDRPRTHWRDCIFWLAWEDLGVSPGRFEGGIQNTSFI